MSLSTVKISPHRNYNSKTILWFEVSTISDNIIYLYQMSLRFPLFENWNAIYKINGDTAQPTLNKYLLNEITLEKTIILDVTM